VFSVITNFFLDKFSQMNYISIIILMTIESSFIPFPSEIVIPPAAYLASKGQLNIYLVILSGVIGSILGALINYFLAVFLGRALVYKMADTKLMHWMMIDRQKIEKAEKYFNKYGAQSTLIGRLIPAIRQLISIPAGLAKMNMGKFLFYTFLGSAIWNTILALLGYYLGENEDILKLYYQEIKIGFMLLLILAAMYLLGRYFWKKYKRNQQEAIEINEIDHKE
jgi:membrane protein DedA with SNARE-associated domain